MLGPIGNEVKYGFSLSKTLKIRITLEIILVQLIFFSFCLHFQHISIQSVVEMGLHFFSSPNHTAEAALWDFQSIYTASGENSRTALFSEGKKSLSYQIHIKKRGRNLWKLPEVPISDFTIAYRYQRKVLLLCNRVNSLAQEFTTRLKQTLWLAKPVSNPGDLRKGNFGGGRHRFGVKRGLSAWRKDATVKRKFKGQGHTKPLKQ